MDGSERGVDGNFGEIGPAQSRELRVRVREDAPCQQRIVGEINARNDVRGAECDLLRFGEKVVRVAIEREAAHCAQRHQLFRNQFRGVEHVKGPALGVLFGKDLQRQIPLRKVAALNRGPQIAPIEIRIGSADLDGLVPDERVRALRRLPVELAQPRLSRLIPKISPKNLSFPKTKKKVET